MTKPRRDILILCGDADGNLGDRAILTAACRTIQALDPLAGIHVVSREPAAMSERLGVRAITKGFVGLPRLCAAALRSRLVLVGGGGLFQDDDSLIKMPYWAARCSLARLLAPRLAAFSLGIGPLDAGSSRGFGRIAFGLMERISARDPLAQQTAAPLASKPVEVVPDPAFMLEPLDDAAAVRCLTTQGVPLDDGPLIGVTVRRWFPPKRRLVPNMIAARFRDTAKQDADSAKLVSLLAQVLDRVAEHTGGRIVMMPTYTVPHEGDDRLSRQVMSAMTCRRSHLVQIDDPALYKAVARRLAVMVGGRMHSTIFAASVGTPVVGLAYNPKFVGVFELLQIPRFVMRVERFLESGDVDGLSSLVLSAMASQRELRERSERLAASTREWLAEVLR